MDIFDGAEGFLPEFELDGGVELGETGVEMVLEDFGILKVDRVRLVRVFRDVGEVESEGLAQATEFDLALVLKTELERLLGDLLGINVRHSALLGS